MHVLARWTSSWFGRLAVSAETDLLQCRPNLEQPVLTPTWSDELDAGWWDSRHVEREGQRWQTRVIDQSGEP